MKFCSTCSTDKVDSDFHKRAASNDGLAARCRDCQRKYDKARSGSVSRAEARARYAKTERGLSAGSRAKKAWCDRNAIKRGASALIGNAIKSGRIEKQHFCSICGIDNVRIHGHHDDYAHPLTVRWLCTQCHDDWHKENGEGLNGE